MALIRCKSPKSWLRAAETLEETRKQRFGGTLRFSFTPNGFHRDLSALDLDTDADAERQTTVELRWAIKTICLKRGLAPELKPRVG